MSFRGQVLMKLEGGLFHGLIVIHNIDLTNYLMSCPIITSEFSISSGCESVLQLIVNSFQAIQIYQRSRPLSRNYKICAQLKDLFYF